MEFGDSILRHLGGGATDAEAARTQEAGQRRGREAAESLGTDKFCMAGPIQERNGLRIRLGMCRSLKIFDVITLLL